VAVKRVFSLAFPVYWVGVMYVYTLHTIIRTLSHNEVLSNYNT
jgi:hypothetical protein